MAQAGNDGTTNHVAENNIIKFKEADVIGHPGGAALTPVLNPTCATFPSPGPNIDAQDGGYAWALWRPYSCC